MMDNLIIRIIMFPNNNKNGKKDTQRCQRTDKCAVWRSPIARLIRNELILLFKYEYIFQFVAFNASTFK